MNYNKTYQTVLEMVKDISNPEFVEFYQNTQKWRQAMNEIAIEGQVFVCLACGKRSLDIYGDMAINPGWDTRCMMNAVLCYSDKLILDEDKRVKDILPDGQVKVPSTYKKSPLAEYSL